MLGLPKWPNKNRRVKIVTHTWRLAAVQGDIATPLERRTYPFTVIVDKTLPADRIQAAVMIRAAEMAADMAGIMEREMLNALAEETGRTDVLD